MNPSALVVMSKPQWEAFLADLYEREGRLDRRSHGVTYAPDEAVDAYVLSSHAEALRSADIDGDLWTTLADIEEQAIGEEEAWEKIVSFYTSRDCILIRVTGTQEPEEWILAATLARRLGLIA